MLSNMLNMSIICKPLLLFVCRWHCVFVSLPFYLLSTSIQIQGLLIKVIDRTFLITKLFFGDLIPSLNCRIKLEQVKKAVATRNRFCFVFCSVQCSCSLYYWSTIRPCRSITNVKKCKYYLKKSSVNKIRSIVHDLTQCFCFIYLPHIPLTLKLLSSPLSPVFWFLLSVYSSEEQKEVHCKIYYSPKCPNICRLYL